MKLGQKLAIRYIRANLHILALLSKRKAAKKAMEIFFTPLPNRIKKMPPVFEKGRKLVFRLAGKTICGYSWKPSHESVEHSGKILLLHGFGSNAKKFEQYINPLLKKGYEVFAFDAPAHGESGGKRLNLPMYTALIEKIIELYGAVDSFIAHSMGGLAIVHFLESVPEPFKGKLVLIAPATETVTSIDLFFRFLQLDDGVREEFDRLVLEKTGQNPDYFSIRRAISHIKSPVLWIHDEEDDITPVSDAKKVKADRHRNVKFIFTRGLGHRRIYRDEMVMKQVLEFL